MQIPRLMIAAPQGRTGKTTISIGLCAAIKQRGSRVKPFKKGPDYIDPSWLGAAAGMNCSNLDPYMFDEVTLTQGFQQSCAGADAALIEASMGLYDSSDPDGKGSSAWLARLLQVPVILVINSARMTRSAAAMVLGYTRFEPDTNFAGVILNNVSGKRHEDNLVNSIERHCSVPVVGVIPRDERLQIMERYLGIIHHGEQHSADKIISGIAGIIKAHTDLDNILQIARSAPGLPAQPVATQASLPGDVKIGVLLDKAFTFYYPENLEALRNAGATLIFINSLKDTCLPDIDGLYIGGGFPELYLDELEANYGLRGDIWSSAEGRLPIYAECAGLMYLCRSITSSRRRFEMSGVINADIVVERRPQGHGYTLIKVSGKNPFFPAGTVIRGHEFHYSRLMSSEHLNSAYTVMRGQGIDGKADGITYRNVLASYTHIHAWSVPDWAPNFVKLAAARQKESSKITV